MDLSEYITTSCAPANCISHTLAVIWQDRDITQLNREWPGIRITLSHTNTHTRASRETQSRTVQARAHACSTSNATTTTPLLPHTQPPVAWSQRRPPLLSASTGPRAAHRISVIPGHSRRPHVRFTRRSAHIKVYTKSIPSLFSFKCIKFVCVFVVSPTWAAAPYPTAE